MEKRERTSIIDIPIALLAGFSITSLGVVVLALSLLGLSVSEEMVDGGILIIYILSCFMAGRIMGKKRKTKRFLRGIFIGVMYYFVLFLASFLLGDSLEFVISDVVTSLMICSGSATLGGMLS